MQKRFAVFFLSIFIALIAVSAPAFAAWPERDFEFIAPAGPGSAWDRVFRAAAEDLAADGIITTKMTVTNEPGEGGGIALTDMQRSIGESYKLIIFSPPLLYINLMGDTAFGYKDLTPIAMIMQGYAAFAVRADSPYKTIGDVMDALKQNPKALKVGGTSAHGSMDHVQFLIAAKEASVGAIDKISYTGFAGGDDVERLLDGTIDVLSSGPGGMLAPVRDGKIRVLAVTSDERLGSMPDVPTLKDAGINAGYLNWRGIFGPLNMPAEDRDKMAEALKKMTDGRRWRERCEANGWVNAYMGPDEFRGFLDARNDEARDVLYELGLLSIQPFADPTQQKTAGR